MTMELSCRDEMCSSICGEAQVGEDAEVHPYSYPWGHSCSGPQPCHMLACPSYLEPQAPTTRTHILEYVLLQIPRNQVRKSQYERALDIAAENPYQIKVLARNHCVGHKHIRPRQTTHARQPSSEPSRCHEIPHWWWPHGQSGTQGWPDMR